MSSCLQTDSLLSSGELAREGLLPRLVFVKILQRAVIRRKTLPLGRKTLSQLAEGVIQKLDVVAPLVTDPPRAHSPEETRESV